MMELFDCKDEEDSRCNVDGPMPPSLSSLPDSGRVPAISTSRSIHWLPSTSTQRCPIFLQSSSWPCQPSSSHWHTFSANAPSIHHVHFPAHLKLGMTLVIFVQAHIVHPQAFPGWIFCLHLGHPPTCHHQQRCLRRGVTCLQHSHLHEVTLT